MLQVMATVEDDKKFIHKINVCVTVEMGISGCNLEIVIMNVRRFA